MLDYSERVARVYANLHGYDYLRYDGIKRGCKGHHATFNRIYLLENQILEGKYDWVLYIDADDIIVDLKKPLDEFLKDEYAVVGCTGGDD